jgi:hypothetical protein
MEGGSDGPGGGSLEAMHASSRHLMWAHVAAAYVRDPHAYACDRSGGSPPSLSTQGSDAGMTGRCMHVGGRTR